MARRDTRHSILTNYFVYLNNLLRLNVILNWKNISPIKWLETKCVNSSFFLIVQCIQLSDFFFQCALPQWEYVHDGPLCSNNIL